MKLTEIKSTSNAGSSHTRYRAVREAAALKDRPTRFCRDLWGLAMLSRRWRDAGRINVAPTWAGEINTEPSRGARSGGLNPPRRTPLHSCPLLGGGPEGPPYTGALRVVKKKGLRAGLRKSGGHKCAPLHCSPLRGGGIPLRESADAPTVVCRDLVAGIGAVSYFITEKTTRDKRRVVEWCGYGI